MGHGTRISGVNRNVEAGFALVGGVQRKVTKGLTLVGGVQRDIGFAKTFTVTMTGVWNSSPCYISIDGVKYHAAQTIEVPEGAEMYCCVFNTTSKGSGAISLDGVGVAEQGVSDGFYVWYSYTHIITSNLTANGNQDDMVTYSITITTE